MSKLTFNNLVLIISKTDKIVVEAAKGVLLDFFYSALSSSFDQVF